MIILDGCEKCNCYEDALEIYNLFRKKNVSINMMTYSILLKILGVLEDFENSLKLFEEIRNAKNNIATLYILFFLETLTGSIRKTHIVKNIKDAIL